MKIDIDNRIHQMFLNERLAQIKAIEYRLFAQIEEERKNNTLLNRQKTNELQATYKSFCI